MKLNQKISQYQDRINEHLHTFLTQYTVSPNLTKAMSYSLFAGGKRLRPILAMASCEAVNGNIENVLPVACALEMIHTYSLIHDDLPCMDNDDFRRGNPTNHKIFGEGVAVLAGDGLLTEAFSCLTKPCWNIPDQDKIEIIHMVVQGAGACGMVAGQELDLQSEGKSFDELLLEKIHTHKTGKLLLAAVLAGGKAGQASESQMNQLKIYGENIGLAFQIADDLLDITGTTEQIGKSAGSDAKKNKATYPSLLGLEESRKRAHLLLNKALEAVASFGSKGDLLQYLAKYIVERKS